MKAHLRVGADRQSVTGGGGANQLPLHPRIGRGEVPDREVGRLPAHDKRPHVRQ